MTNGEAIEILRSNEIEITGTATMFWKFVEALQYALQVLDYTDWRDPAVEVPCYEDEDVFMLVCVSGTCGGVTLDHAMELATYNEDDGWCLEWDTSEACIEVHGWMPLPEAPKIKGGESDA